MDVDTRLETLLAHRDWVRDLARRLVHDPDRADDVVQRAWLVAMQRPPRHLGSPRGWLRRVLENVVREDARRTRLRPGVESRAATGRESTDGADAVERLELHDRLVRHVLALPEPYRELVVLRFFDGLAPREIAARRAMPSATVRSYLTRGLGQLRARLDHEHGGDRRAWCLALLPIWSGVRDAAPETAGHAGLITSIGVLLMSKQVVGTLAVLVLLLGSLALIDSDRAREQAPLTSAARDGTGRDGTRRTSPAPDRRPPPGAEREQAVGRATAIGITGRVTSADGIPLGGATVTALRAEPRLELDGFDGAARRFASSIPAATATCDEAGHYRLGLARPGLWRLRARGAGFEDRIQEGELEDDGRRDFELPATTPLRVRVHDEDGAAIRGVIVAVHLSLGSDLRQNRSIVEIVETDADGEVPIRRQRNMVQHLHLRHPGYVPLSCGPPVGVPEAGLVLTMKRGRRLTLRVLTVGDAMPASGFRPLLTAPGSAPRLIETDANGGAAVDGVPPTEVVDLRLETVGWALRPDPAHDDPTSVGDDGCRYSAERDGPGTLQVIVDGGGVIHGRIVDRWSGAPVPGVPVRVGDIGDAYFRPMSLARVTRDRSDDDGRFTLRGLDAADLDLVVEDPTWPSSSTRCRPTRRPPPRCT